jgi:hypothetical protein
MTPEVVQEACRQDRCAAIQLTPQLGYRLCANCALCGSARSGAPGRLADKAIIVVAYGLDARRHSRARDADFAHDVRSLSRGDLDRVRKPCARFAKFPRWSPRRRRSIDRLVNPRSPRSSRSSAGMAGASELPADEWENPTNA